MDRIKTSVNIGAVMRGTVMDVAKFGAFVKLPGGKTGLVHISQVSDKYVKEVSDHVKTGDSVLVKIVSMDDKGRIQLSMKAVTPEEVTQLQQAGGEGAMELAPAAVETAERPPAPRPFDGRPHRHHGHHDGHGEEDSFEKKLRFFMRQSEDRLVDVRRNLDSKRGIKKKKNR